MVGIRGLGLPLNNELEQRSQTRIHDRPQDGLEQREHMASPGFTCS